VTPSSRRGAALPLVQGAQELDFWVSSFDNNADVGHDREAGIQQMIH
jgi:hypothetical protein